MKTNNPLDFFAPKKKNTKGGKGSGHHGHGGLPGVHGGSSPKAGLPITPSPVTVAELDMLNKQLIEEGGYSYQPIGKRHASSGYMVSQAETEVSMPLRKDHRKNIKAFIMDNVQKFKDDDDTYAGGWIASEKDKDKNPIPGTEKVFFDVSVNVSDLQEACIMGIRQRQRAIFNLNEFVEIGAIDYLDKIDQSLWNRELIIGAYDASELMDDNKGEFMKKYTKKFGEDFLDQYKERMTAMKEEKEIKPRKHEWVGKPRSEWTKQDYEDNKWYQNNREPLRFIFGKDTTEEDVDTFLDNILED